MGLRMRISGDLQFDPGSDYNFLAFFWIFLGPLLKVCEGGRTESLIEPLLFEAFVGVVCPLMRITMSDSLLL